MDEILNQLKSLQPIQLAVVSALSVSVATIVSTLLTLIIGKLVVTPFLSARDKQDRESEWRKHAIELTKMDLERKLKSGRNFSLNPLRPSVLDFLANYRDLQELGKKSPKDLYEDIRSKRISSQLPPKMISCVFSMSDRPVPQWNYAPNITIRFEKF